VGYHKKCNYWAGISGLACAYRLGNWESLSRSRRQGSRRGLIAPVTKERFPIEAGPQCPRFVLRLVGLVRRIKSGKEFVAGEREQSRYIMRDGQAAPGAFFAAGLIGTDGKDRLKLRILTRLRLLAATYHMKQVWADFVNGKIWPEVLEYLVDLSVHVFLGKNARQRVESAFPAPPVEW